MEGGTGVFYQAMPAVGPDGRNVMKLIPVQKVDGQFFQTAFNTEKDSVEVEVKVHSKANFPPVASLSQSQTRFPSLQPISNGRYVLKAPTQVSTLFNSPKVQHVQQVHVAVAKPTVSQNTLQTNGQPTAVVQKLPVTVKSPVLPSGHCLQIPPYAQVRTVPASALPQSIKSHILNHASTTPTNDTAQPTVLMVSPVNSVKLNSNQQMISLTQPSQILNTLSQHLHANSGTSSKTSEEVTTPIKWVVQEETGIPGPCLVPASSTQVNSVTLKSITGASEIVANKSTSTQISEENIIPGKNNALVMCNGRVYFVGKRNSEIAKDVMISEGGRKGALSVSPALPASSALGSDTSKVTKEGNPKIKASEVIDLCDDDEEESFTSLGGSPGNLPTQSQTEMDESSEDSNVIFVSYIPPKSEMEKDTRSASQNKREDKEIEMEMNEKSASENEKESMAHAEMEINEGQENTAAEEDDAQMDVEEQVKESEPAEMNLSSLCENVDMEGKKLSETESSSITIGDASNRDGAAFAETVSSMDGILEQLHNSSVPATDNTEKTSENPAPDQKTQHKNDHQLRKEFGITSDVQICLKRVKPSEKPEPQTDRPVINKRTLDGLRKVIMESKLQSKIKMMMQVPHRKTEDDEDTKKSKRTKLDQDDPSLSTTNILPASECKDKSEDISVFPMETSLISHTSQKEVCSSSHKTEGIAKSTAGEVHMQSKPSTDCTDDTHTPSSELNVPTQTTSHTIPPSSVLRKTSARFKKGKVCTACPCGTLLGVTQTTTSLQSQETPPAVLESNKGARKSCLHETPRETCPTIGEHQYVKKARKKRSSSSPRKKKSPLTKSTCKTSHSISSPDDITTSLNASSFSLQESNIQNSPPLNETEGNTLLSSNTQTETTEQNTSMMQEALNESSVPSFSKQQGSTVDELPTQDLYSMEVLDAEEIKRQERIKRLKDLLKEKEAALERMRHSMNV